MLLRDHLIQQGIKQGMQQGIEQGRQEGLKQGIQQGMQRGLKQGIKKEKRVIAARLLARGENVEIVAKLTGLTIQEIQTILNFAKN